MLAELADFDRCVAASIRGGGGGDRTQAYRRVSTGLLKAMRQPVDRTDETVRECENDGDQGYADDQLPNIRQAAREVGASRPDAQRPLDGADGGPAAAERDHDDQPGPERETGILRRGDPSERGVTEPGDGRDDRGEHQD